MILFPLTGRWSSEKKQAYCGLVARQTGGGERENKADQKKIEWQRKECESEAVNQEFNDTR